MHGLLAALAALAVPLALASPVLVERQNNPTSPPAVIDLGYAQYQGVLDSVYNMYEWRGIRYATAQRFKAPQTPSGTSSGSSPILANQYGPVCYTAAGGVKTLAGNVPPPAYVPPNAYSEDCLFLNVVAPAGSGPGSNLPVAVFIHGGGYSIGNGRNEFEQLLNLVGRKAVIVGIQYRLGPFGFLAGSEMVANGATNAGLLDQQFALQWVQNNIGKFGGSSDHVTIFGESAGAGSVLNQVVANGGNTMAALGLHKPLFKAALGFSMFLPTQVTATSPTAQAIYDNLVAATGCYGAQSTFSCLQSANADVLAAAGINLSQNRPAGVWTYLPVIDGKFLTARASTLLAKGQQNLNGDYLWGNNNFNEGYIFTDQSISADPSTDPNYLAFQFDTLLAGLFPLITAQERQAVAQQYPISKAPALANTFWRIATVIADSTFSCPTYWAAEAFGTSGRKSTFNFGQSTHGEDLGWYTNTIYDGGKSVSSVNSFTGAIGGFLTTFDPNQNTLDATINPPWPTYNTGDEMVFSLVDKYNLYSNAAPVVVPTTTIPHFGPNQQAACDFWRGSISVNASL